VFIRVDDAQLIGHPTYVRKEIAHRQAALAVAPELPRWAQQLARRVELHARLRVGKRLAVITKEEWLVVERVDVRRRPVHEQKDDALGPRREMWRAFGQRVTCNHSSFFRTQPRTFSHQGREGYSSEPRTGALEQFSTGDWLGRHGSTLGST